MRVADRPVIQLAAACDVEKFAREIKPAAVNEKMGAFDAQRKLFDKEQKGAYREILGSELAGSNGGRSGCGVGSMLAAIQDNCL